MTQAYRVAPTQLAWFNHYGSNYDAQILGFTEFFKQAFLPPGIGEPGYEYGAKMLTCTLLDTRDGKLYDTQITPSYNHQPNHDLFIQDAQFDEVKDVRSLQAYFYGSHHCPCHRKQDAQEAGAVVEDEECEGKRFLIDKIWYPPLGELILWSETRTEEELEERLLKWSVCNRCKVTSADVTATEPQDQLQAWLCPACHKLRVDEI